MTPGRLKQIEDNLGAAFWIGGPTAVFARDALELVTALRETEAEVRADRRRLHEIFTHTLLLPMLGLPLGEMWNLEALAADCAADGRYECLFTSAPLNLPNGVASPPNALAIK